MGVECLLSTGSGTQEDCKAMMVLMVFMGAQCIF